MEAAGIGTSSETLGFCRENRRFDLEQARRLNRKSTFPCPKSTGHRSGYLPRRGLWGIEKSPASTSATCLIFCFLFIRSLLLSGLACYCYDSLVGISYRVFSSSDGSDPDRINYLTCWYHLPSLRAIFGRRLSRSCDLRPQNSKWG